MTFLETASALDEALSDVASKKKRLDEISKEVQFASNDYQDSLNKAQGLRQELDKALADVLPTNVRVRAA